MPAITTPGTFTTGDTFSATNWNNNLFGTTGSVGLYRGLNGGQDSANLAGGFSIQKDIIRRDGVIYPSWTPMQVTSCDWNNELMGSDDGEDFVAVSGCANRFYLPYDCSWVIYYCAGTVEQYLVAHSAVENEDTVIIDELDAFLTMFVNGSRQTRCDTPLQNWTWQSEVASDMDVSRAARLTHHYSFEVMGQNISAGYQEVRMALGIQRTLAGAQTFQRTIDAGPPNYTVNYDIFGRVSVHNRCAYALACK